MKFAMKAAWMDFTFIIKFVQLPQVFPLNRFASSFIMKLHAFQRDIKKREWNGLWWCWTVADWNEMDLMQKFSRYAKREWIKLMQIIFSSVNSSNLSQASFRLEPSQFTKYLPQLLPSTGDIPLIVQQQKTSLETCQKSVLWREVFSALIVMK